MVNIFRNIFKPKRKPIREYLNSHYGKLYFANDADDKHSYRLAFGRRIDGIPASISYEASSYLLRASSMTLNEFIRN